ncbi:MAG: SMC-Scp complex subunit ScpB [Anaerovoracaceae bacterium]|jgi:segregation and condensation protein B
MFSRKVIKAAFESMLYTWGQPLAAKEAGGVFDLSEEQAVEYFEELKKEYEEEGRGIRIRRVGRSYQFVTPPENADFIRQLATPVRVRKLSHAALEVLAIIAYRQPVTKGEIDQIRGIKCDRVVEGLLNKGLIESKGRSDAVGRPVLYGTTEEFLRHFGFESLDDLPEIEDIEGAMDISEEEEESLQMSIDMETQGEGDQHGYNGEA